MNRSFMISRKTRVWSPRPRFPSITSSGVVGNHEPDGKGREMGSRRATVPDPRAVDLLEIAKQENIHIIFGMIEKAQERMQFCTTRLL
jgi:hypothetical protein